jgi:hypothetical protein
MNHVEIIHIWIVKLHGEIMAKKENKKVLRLLLSVDLVGSTAYKYNTEYPSHENLSELRTSVSPWLEAFKMFYTEFPIIFRERYSNVSNYADADRIKFWKAVGDELLFYAEINNKEQIIDLLTAFIKAIQIYQSDLEAQDSKLSLKGTAWTAGFPKINSEIDIEGKLDFIGPSIDTGFRLTKFSSSSNLYISIELAFLLTQANINRDEYLIIYDNIYYDGEEILKGVAKDTPYPKLFILIERNEKAKKYFSIKNKIENKAKLNLNYLEDLATSYINYIDMKSSLIIPYIQNEK